MGLVGDVVREIGNKSREFYEFVLPPVDMHLDEKSLRVVIDMPGFAKEDINLVLSGDILSIKAHKEPPDDATLVTNQRPNVIDKRIRLPIDVRPGEEEIESARYRDGVLTLVIPAKIPGRDIDID